MRIIGFVLIALAVLAGPTLAQALPNHFDPRAREIPAPAAPVPAIRFLTTADFPPFNYADETGALVGFNIDLARAICADVGVACTIQPWPWEQAADALADNQGDALIAGLALTEETAARFEFTAAYLALPGRFVVPAGAATGFTPQALAGRTVAVRAGSAHEVFVSRYLPTSRALPLETEIAALEAVREGEAEAFFGDGMRAAFWLNEEAECCAFAGEPYFRPDLFGRGLAIAVPLGQDAVRQAIDAALVRLNQRGVLAELYLRWFPVGFY